jgi:hypothetical protein
MIEVLCHYTKNCISKKILKRMKLRFGKVVNSNDPVEIKHMNFFYGGESEIKDNIEEDIRNYLNNILHLIAFSGGEIEMDEELIQEGLLHELEKRPAFYLPRMWATYGDNHKGVCFVFEKEKLISIAERRLKKNYYFAHRVITYSDFVCRHDLIEMAPTYDIEEDYVRKNGIYNSVQRYLKNSISNYFIKDNDWRDENEYRFLCWNKIKNHSTQKLEIEIQDALIGVVLGINNNDTEIIKIAKRQEVNNILKLTYDGLLSLEALL